MVNKLEIKGEAVYQCELCEMSYRDIEIAERCEQYCNTHESCSMEIAQKAIHKPLVEFMP